MLLLGVEGSGRDRRSRFTVSAERAHAAIIADAQALIDRIAYTAVNPVAAGLVARPEDWPGVTLWKPTELDVKRPDAFFDARGTCPPVARVRIVQPPRPAMSPEDWRARLAFRIEQRVLAAHKKLRQEGRTFLGRAAVLAQSFVKRALSFEPKRLAAPAVAADRPGTLRRALKALKAFRLAYRDARTHWRAGDRAVEFPVGTWGMRREHSVTLAKGECLALRIGT